MLDSRRLRVLREVARLGSFSAAAESLGYTQPAISRQIATLEESLDRNLTAVQKSHNFEEMAINLSAAIQLLGARLGNLPPGARLREVAGGDAAKHAA